MFGATDLRLTGLANPPRLPGRVSRAARRERVETTQALAERIPLMKPEIRGMALALALLALVGCTLTQTDVRKEASAERAIIGGRGISSKRCTFRIAILSRPAKDEIINTVLWRSADEQLVPQDVRRSLDANGLRVGIVTSDLPPEVRELLNDRQRQKVEEITVVNPCGEPTLISMGAAPQLSLFLSRQDRTVGGKSYQDARGFLRLSGSYGETGGVSLRVVPELHHGPFQQTWAPAPSTSPMSPMQFMGKHGQQEETYRDMEVNLMLQPGQVAVLGNLPDKRGSLGDFLYSSIEPNSDRGVQKVVLVWAGRAEASTTSDGKTEAPVLQPAETPEMPARTSDSLGVVKTDPKLGTKESSPAAAAKR
jgi:hypothetical protein